jgi:hypothetical protein
MLRNKLVKLVAAALLLAPLYGGSADNEDSFLSECANIVAIKNTVEEYVRAVKSRIKRGSREFMQVEDDYSRASEAYEGFVHALENSKAAAPRAAEAQRETRRFIDRCKAILQVDHLTDLETPQYKDFLSSFATALAQRRKAVRTEWIRAIQAELSWSAWDRIR